MSCTASAEVSFSLAVEALAFVHKVRAFVRGHTTSSSTSWRGVHGIRILFGAFTTEPLSPFIEVLFLRRGLFLFGLPWLRIIRTWRCIRRYVLPPELGMIARREI